MTDGSYTSLAQAVNQSSSAVRWEERIAFWPTPAKYGYVTNWEFAPVVAAAEQIAVVDARSRDQNSTGSELDYTYVESIVALGAAYIGVAAHQALERMQLLVASRSAQARTGRRQPVWIWPVFAVVVLVLEVVVVREPLEFLFQTGDGFISWLVAGAFALVFMLAGYSLATALFAGFRNKRIGDGEGRLGRGAVFSGAGVLLLAIIMTLVGLAWIRIVFLDLRREDAAAISSLDTLDSTATQAAEQASSLLTNMPEVLSIAGVMMLASAFGFVMKATATDLDTALRIKPTSGYLRKRLRGERVIEAQIDALEGFLVAEESCRESVYSVAAAHRAAYLRELNPDAREYQQEFESDHQPEKINAIPASPWVDGYAARLRHLRDTLHTPALPVIPVPEVTAGPAVGR
jgi:hypothetical protein